MTVEKPGVVLLWPDAQNYARFKEVCSDEIHDSAEAYQAAVEPKLKALIGQGIGVEKMAFDPDDLAAWARSEGRKVDPNARAQFAAMLKAKAEGA